MRVAKQRGGIMRQVRESLQPRSMTASAAQYVGRNGPVAHKPLFRVTGVARSFPVVVLGASGLRQTSVALRAKADRPEQGKGNEYGAEAPPGGGGGPERRWVLSQDLPAKPRAAEMIEVRDVDGEPQDPRRDCPWKCRRDDPNCICTLADRQVELDPAAKRVLYSHLKELYRK